MSLTLTGDAGAEASACQRQCIQARHFRHVVEVDELRQIAVLDAVFGAQCLMLMIEIFAGLGEAYCGVSLLVEG